MYLYEMNNVSLHEVNLNDFNVSYFTSDSVWFVRLYGKIIHERLRVDYRL